MQKKSFFKRLELADVEFNLSPADAHVSVDIKNPEAIEAILAIAEKYADKFESFNVYKPTANLAVA